MQTFKNAAGKRVCDISEDQKTIEIKLKECITRITANPDGTLTIENISPFTAA